MRLPSHILYRLVLIAALATVVLSGRPGSRIRAAALEASTNLGSGIASIPPTPWTAVAASGRVASRGRGMPDDGWLRVRRGDWLPPQSLVRTGPRGRATLTRGEDIILVDPDSELLLPLGAFGDAGTNLLHNHGNVLYEVHRDQRVHFQVVTPYLVAGARATVFSVLVQDEFTAVTVSEGHVAVHATFTGERVDLFTGDMAVLSGPMDRLMVHRDPLEGLPPGGRREDMLLRRSREGAGQLVRRAAGDDLGEPVLYDFDSGTFVDGRRNRRLGGLDESGEEHRGSRSSPQDPRDDEAVLLEPRRDDRNEDLMESAAASGAHP